MRSGRKAQRVGRGRRFARFPVAPDLFRETRCAAGLDRQQAADLLGVSLRTIGHWETGACRVPYAPFKLLRILRNGDLFDPAWSGCRLIRGKLVTPENHEIWPHDLAWLSLLVRRAEAFSHLLADRDRRPHGEAASQRTAVRLSLDCNGVAPVPVSEASRDHAPAVVARVEHSPTPPPDHPEKNTPLYGGVVFNVVQVGGAAGAAVGPRPPCSNTGRIRSTLPTHRAGGVA